MRSLRPIRLAASAAVFCLSTTGVAQVATQDAPCAQLESVRQILECALVKHPKISRARNTTEQAEVLEGRAKQIPNPEVGTRALWGNTLGDNVFVAEVNLAQPLEIWGTRSARIAQARAEQEAALASLLGAKEEVYIETLGSLYRIRQIQTELGLLEEALETFSRVKSHFGSRPALGPEQRVSQDVFDLATADYKLRKASLESDLFSLVQQLELSIGQPIAPKGSILPEPKKTWPVVEESTEEVNLGGSRFRLAQAELKAAEAELDSARAASWPALSLGPSYETQKEGAISSYTLGINLSISLPLWNQNSGGRAFAHRGLMAAERGQSLERRQLVSERQTLARRYRNAVDSLKSTFAADDLERRHKRLEGFFERGLVSSSLVIEAHRQMIDLAKSRHELELSALEALWMVRAIEGTLFEEQL